MQLAENSYGFMGIALAVTFQFFMGVAQASGTGAGEDSEIQLHRWINENYPAALEKVLPPGYFEPDKFPKDAEWSVTTRIVPSFEEQEYRLSLTKFWDGRVIASVKAPRNGPLSTQLRQLRRQNPGTRLENLIEKISVEEFEISRKEEQRLEDLVQRFEAIRMAPALPAELTMDATTYDFWCESLYGARLEVHLAAPRFKVDEHDHPLVQWAEQLRAVVEEYRQKIRARKGELSGTLESHSTIAPARR